MKTKAFLLLVILFLLPNCPWAAPLTRENAPAALREWVPWVLAGHEEELACPARANAPASRLCAWPSRLRLSVAAGGANFSQEWLVQNPGWAALPGSPETWPREVAIDSKPASVVERGSAPAVWLDAGVHTVSGRFAWDAVPEALQLPRETALLDLSVNSRIIESPQRDDAGRLWLRRGEAREAKEEDRLLVRVFRLVEDSIPLRMVFQIDLEVAGADREVGLGRPLAGLPLVPLALTAQVPARLRPDGELRAQVRPGHWTLTLTARCEGAVIQLPLVNQDLPWPAEEVWAFKAHPELRVTEVEGLTPLDPRQTTLPEAWRSLPAFRVKAGEAMQLKQTKRGDPDPGQDRLALQRNLWLRFDGSGYTASDTITGSKFSDWRLEMGPRVHLGRVAVDGMDRFITRQAGTDRDGVELRRGEVHLAADSEIAFATALPATGWKADFSSASGTLHLPPGWRIMAASGVDRIATTWWDSWTLLDFFLTLILSLAAARLWGRPFGLLFAATLVLNYHEPGAPRWVWPVLLAAVALCRLLPEGVFLRGIRLVRFAALLILLGLSLPYMVAQVRHGIYPQLESPGHEMGLADSMFGIQNKMGVEMAPQPEPAAAPPLESRMKSASSLAGAAADMAFREKAEPARLAQFDPKMVNQTGPGLPTWSWRRVSYNWSGPVHRDQEMRFFLLGPRANLGLALLRVLLLTAAIAGVLGVRHGRAAGLSLPSFRSVLMAVTLVCVLMASGSARAADYPPQELLDSLRQRLLEQEPCFPDCAAIEELTVKTTATTLILELTVNSLAGKLALPLPGAPGEWLPAVVTQDGKNAGGLAWSNGSLWVMLERGRHRLEMTGRLPDRKGFQLAFPLKPHRAVLQVEGWTVAGVLENGRMEGQLQFTRAGKPEGRPEKEGEIEESGPLPPFVQIERHLLLDLKWRMVTTVSRLSPTGTAVALTVPLLPGESVLTEGVRVEGGMAQITLDQNASALRWESSLEMQPEFVLRHLETHDWTEIWRLSASPVWHVKYAGLPVIFHQEGGEWAPVWHPWPGEEVRLAVTRPEGVLGRTMTIDRSALSVRPGSRATEAELTLVLRSSQGGQHQVRLPEGAELQGVTVDGRAQSIRLEGRNVTLPLVPGRQSFGISWREPSGISNRYHLPAVDLGTESVNTEYEFKTPENRWVLFACGPRLGPAVLFYSFLLVLALAAFALGRLDLTPLSFGRWFLLGVGLSQASVLAVGIVAGWVLALGWRKNLSAETPRRPFNAVQVGLGLLTLVALVTLVVSISQGLLGHPDMQIRGHGSSAWLLRWYQDRSGPTLPEAWVLSVPMFFYRAAMLAWALWTSFAVLEILKWGWSCISRDGTLWKRKPRPQAGEAPEMPVKEAGPEK